ncbi:glycosyltransferase involved in cell wall biosynthesis [Arthrobacter silviterrae]|nr:glycosyltransferase family 4 protein [Arthrobacter silviterrae]MDQ0279531.1 glycosyltransferase involved in cell wall biosynthesis [Arthrobacter silviterrae]
MSTVHLVVPRGIDNPARPSGGNVYDRRMSRELAAAGWTVAEHAVPGAWPVPDADCARALADLLDRLEDGATVLLDGLLLPALPPAAAWAGRLCLVVLAHTVPSLKHDAGTSPRAHRPGSAVPGSVLAAATAIVATSHWTKDQLVAAGHGVPAENIHVVEPGADRAGIATGSPGGGRLLCVAAVTEAKGQDTVLAALAGLARLDWDFTCVGACDLDPGFTTSLLRDARDAGIAGRVHLVGPRTGAALEAMYASADILLLASRTESYGMVVAEALVRGLPVIATGVGGVPRTLAGTDSGCLPGLLVPPGDPAALAACLEAWLDDPGLRRRLRGAARERGAALERHSWRAAARRLSSILAHAAGVSSAAGSLAASTPAAGTPGNGSSGNGSSGNSSPGRGDGVVGSRHAVPLAASVGGG